MRITALWLRAPDTQKVCAVLADAGHQALFVGGCVRNALMGKAVSDLDIATDARPDQIMALAEEAGLRAIPTGIEHGTITVVSGGVPHEITTFRADIDTDGRRATVRFSDDVKEDAARRDFTMNALYASADGTVVDPLGGLGDLRAARVRFIGDASKRIREDYLRSLRFFRFFAWYGDQSQGLDAEGLAAIAGHLDGLQALSRERVGAEVLKLLAAPDPCQAIAGMRQPGVLAAIMPGANDAPLGPLVHYETMFDLAPDAIVRLAALGGEDMRDHLRLSNADARKLDVLRDAASGMKSAGHLGYALGREVAQWVILLRSAMLETPVPEDSFADIAQGAAADFPVSAADLMPEYSGKALGDRLKELEKAWIASGFAMSRSDLIG